MFHLSVCSLVLPVCVTGSNKTPSATAGSCYGRRKTPGRSLALPVLFGALGLGAAAEADVLFVKPTSTGAGDCGSWADACTLPDALNTAVAGDEVWVMAGTYGPFKLKNDVQIIGGFAGTETTASQSNPATNVTIVDGGGTKRCINSANHSAATLLRGFNIRNGNDMDDPLSHVFFDGGGLSLSDSSAMIVQCTFENNTSFLGGAVGILGGSSPQFVNCIFRHNGATVREDPPYEGGAVFLGGGTATFTNCLFHDNKANRGGAFATIDGPALFINCTFANNQATWRRGGAVSDPSESLYLRNCVLWGNTRLEGDPPTPVLDQIHGPGDGPEVAYCDVQGGWSGRGRGGNVVIDADPLFKDVAGGKFNLQFGSPCQDTGSSALLPLDVADLDWDGNTIEALPFDLALRPRTLGIAVDMGAYETPFCGDGICEADESSCNCPQDCGPAPMNEEAALSCNDGKDNDCDGLVDCDDSDCGSDPACMGIIPTVSEWGLVILALLLLTGAKIYFGHQPGRVPAR
jgi:hypothetical protein